MDWLMRLLAVSLLLFLAEVLLHGRFALSGLTYARTYSKRTVFVGEEIYLTETVANAKALPVASLQIECRLHHALSMQGQSNILDHDGSWHKSLFSLMPFMRVTRSHRIVCSTRGYYPLHSVALTATDLFGISSRGSAAWPVETALVVYPVPIDPDESTLPCHGFFGDVTVRRWLISDPFLISGVREYQSGDPMKTINWKASAKKGDWMVNQPDYTANTRLMLILNVESSETQWGASSGSALVETGIRLAAGIVRYAVSNGLEVGFATNGHVAGDKSQPATVPSGSGEQQLYTVWETLATLVTERASSFVALLQDISRQQMPETDYLILTAFTDERIEDMLAVLRLSGSAAALQLIGGESA